MSDWICQACEGEGDSGTMAWGRDEETLLGVWVHDACLQHLIHKHRQTLETQLFVALRAHYWGVGFSIETAVHAMQILWGEKLGKKGKDYKVLKLPPGSYAPCVNDAGQVVWSHFDGAKAGDGEWVI
ncbi:hypothetical protein LCGC14_2328070 [marine sediment metagenome]|uniref:Uncharacterized protein n=1 Tax=marine sediment metagenome TaxID=412755 RepID=A0A0F9ETB6_9ZZZZ